MQSPSAHLSASFLKSLVPYLHQDRFVFTEKERHSIGAILSEMKAIFSSIPQIHPSFMRDVEKVEARWNALSSPECIEYGVSLADFDLRFFLGAHSFFSIRKQLNSALNKETLKKITELVEALSTEMFRFNSHIQLARTTSGEALKDAFYHKDPNNLWLRDWDAWDMCYVSNPYFFTTDVAELSSISRISVMDDDGDVSLSFEFRGSSLIDLVSFVKEHCYDNTGNNGFPSIMAIYDLKIDDTEPTTLIVKMRQKQLGITPTSITRP